MGRERKFRTFRLHPADKKAVQALGKVGGQSIDRHDALLELVAELPKLDLPVMKSGERVPMRLGIPTELDEAINEVKKRTKQTYVSILLAAVHQKVKEGQKPRRGRPPKKKTESKPES